MHASALRRRGVGGLGWRDDRTPMAVARVTGIPRPCRAAGAQQRRLRKRCGYPEAPPGNAFQGFGNEVRPGRKTKRSPDSTPPRFGTRSQGIRSRTVVAGVRTVSATAIFAPAVAGIRVDFAGAAGVRGLQGQPATGHRPRRVVDLVAASPSPEPAASRGQPVPRRTSARCLVPLTPPPARSPSRTRWPVWRASATGRCRGPAAARRRSSPRSAGRLPA
jgi:hypothetical protein